MFICVAWTMSHGLILGLVFFYCGSFANKEYPLPIYGFFLILLLSFTNGLAHWLVGILRRQYQDLGLDLIFVTMCFDIMWGFIGANVFDFAWHLASGGSVPMNGTHLQKSTAGITFICVSVMAGAVLGIRSGNSIRQNHREHTV